MIIFYYYLVILGHQVKLKKKNEKCYTSSFAF